MYVCNECGYESEKTGKHCGKPMVEQKDEETMEEDTEEEVFEGEE